MKKYTLFILLSTSISLFSQQKTEFWDHIRFGGSFSLGLGTQTTIAILPSAVYDFDNGFSLGTGISYQYSKYENFNANVYGLSILGLYQIPATNLQFSTELEQLYLNQNNGINTYKTNYPALHIGFAYQQGRASFGLRYDVLYDQNKSIYASAFSPIIRFYF